MSILEVLNNFVEHFEFNNFVPICANHDYADFFWIFSVFYITCSYRLLYCILVLLLYHTHSYRTSSLKSFNIRLMILFGFNIRFG